MSNFVQRISTLMSEMLLGLDRSLQNSFPATGAERRSSATVSSCGLSVPSHCRGHKFETCTSHQKYSKKSKACEINSQAFFVWCGKSVEKRFQPHFSIRKRVFADAFSLTQELPHFDSRSEIPKCPLSVP